VSVETLREHIEARRLYVVTQRIDWLRISRERRAEAVYCAPLRTSRLSRGDDLLGHQLLIPQPDAAEQPGVGVDRGHLGTQLTLQPR
jgi:hypothetical protein